MRLNVRHQTSYHYDAPVQYALQQLRLTPKSRANQRVIDWQISIEGGCQQVAFDDHHNNRVVLVSFDADRQSIVITCEGEVETQDSGGVIGEHGGFAPLWYFCRSTALTAPGPRSRQLVRALGKAAGTDVAELHDLSRLVADAVVYEAGKTHAATSAEAALEAGHGVCQDYAHIFITAARLMNVPARYVSGYLMMDDRVEQDASHAWAEAHVDGLGWVGFDVANGICPDERYIRVATGLDYREAAPVSGMRFGEGEESMIVTLQVQQ